MYKPPKTADSPKHMPLSVKWKNKEGEELAEYYWYMAGKASSANEKAFYIKGYIDIKAIDLPEVYLRGVVRGRIDSFLSKGYSIGDIASYCRLDMHIIRRLKDPPKDTHKTGRKKLNDSYLCALFELEPEKIRSRGE